MLETVLFNTQCVCSITHVKVAPGWALIEVNFDPGRKGGGGCPLQDHHISIQKLDSGKALE